MNTSKRNPLLRNNMDEFNKIIGSLGDEIKEQNLDNINGGTSPVISVTTPSAVVVISAASRAASVAISKIVSKK